MGRMMSKSVRKIAFLVSKQGRNEMESMYLCVKRVKLPQIAVPVQEYNVRLTWRIQ